MPPTPWSLELPKVLSCTYKPQLPNKSPKLSVLVGTNPLREQVSKFKKLKVLLLAPLPASVSQQATEHELNQRQINRVPFKESDSHSHRKEAWPGWDNMK